MTQSFEKDPQAVLDYQVDWAAWLAEGETITDATVTVPSGLTLDSQEHSGTAVIAWLSGGTAGVNYEVTFHVVTSAGREDDRTLRILCKQR